MESPVHKVWLHRFAVLTALATFGLIGMGGLVTSHEAGMAVPDWPTSYGYNMFALPIHFWRGGVFYEHSHRLWATVVGTLVVFLTRWLGGGASRKWLAVVGAGETLAGFALNAIKPELKGAGYFLSGIGSVVLLAALVWSKNQPASKPLPTLGWTAFWLVQLQGLLGGLRVVLFKDQIGILHGALAQLFFLVLCIIALLTSRWWYELPSRLALLGAATADAAQSVAHRKLGRVLIFTTSIIFIQLLIGATMRHQHAGLAIPDFPLAYGKVWPDTSPAAVASYNAQRIELIAGNSITAFQIWLQMAHRMMAVVILCSVAFCAWSARQYVSPCAVRKLTLCWLGLILVQASLGAWTIWSNKAADVATAHVLTGALSLVLGALLAIITVRLPARAGDLR